MKTLKRLLGGAAALSLALSLIGPISPAFAVPPLAGERIDLGTAANFAILSTTGITNAGGNISVINGDIGTSPTTAASMDTVFCSEVNGTIYGANAAYTGSGDVSCFAGTPADNATVATAVGDRLAAYNDGVGAASVANGGFTSFGGTLDPADIIPPGVYNWTGNVTIPTFVTLTGDANDVWIFQIGGTFATIAGGTSVILSGGAQASNVFWVVTGTTSLAAASTFNGTILSGPGASTIALGNAGTVNGRLLGGTDVTLIANTINAPSTLNIIKTVVGGPLLPAGFDLHVMDSSIVPTEVLGSPAAGVVAPGREYTLDAGTYTVSEDPEAGYAATFSANCPAGVISLTANDLETCTVTNTYTAPGGGFVFVPTTLTVIKTVINDNGGTKLPADFPLFVSGLPVVSDAPNSFLSPAVYIVSETADPNYTQVISGDCDVNVRAIKQNSIEEVGYALTPKQLFHSLAERGRQGEFILDDLANTLKSIEQSTLGTDSADDFANLFEDLDLNSTKLGNSANDRNELVAKVLSHLDDIDFDISNTESDVLGDAYEYLIGEFASGAGKKAGEFYTPQTVSTLLAKIVTQGKMRLRSVYDPTCGSGSLLLRVKREVQDVDMIYGQEMNRTTYNLARMNMILHDVHFAKFDIKQENTLTRPQHEGKTFDAVVANPPFSANWSADPLFLQDPRFSNYGKLAPSSKADMAFVQHMIHQLDEHGTMAVVLPHGVLFRGSSEGVIRRYLIEQMNVIDTIIGLPANIFYGTSIPTCILVLKKNREHTGDILFIDASNDFEKQKNQNKLLPEHLDNILGAFENRQNIEKYAHVASLKEIADNDFNLNIPRYVDTFEAEAEIDLDAIAKQLQALEGDSQKTDAVIAGFCAELGIDSPFAESK